ncbi:DUF1090 domain-containing protein, partial [Salmonella enterica]|nr:DUF1090 domain-containing protein [Salmonella enterica]
MPATAIKQIQSHAAAPVGCAAKKQEVENQISYAQEH